jgi:hypothetical protein
MAKKSKTDVTARQQAKLQQVQCRYCGQKPDVTRVLTPSGKVQMYRKCCAVAAKAA